ncbi:flagellin [Alsobacter sp. KACC 23698]|uniref:Flagellin n=1 Tax=Alsobacter sp. KACC 23698 TaxID=3149229 RepID=A0AAU7JAS2_9HYPH
MANTVLSQGVRNNLLALQDVAAQSTAVQQRLATGKKVNSAVDNAVNYFTNLGLNDRASQLSSLLDGMSNSVQTIQAASKGIDSITKLIQSAQSTIKQAQADALANRPTKSGTALATAAEVTATGSSLKDVTLNKVLGGAAAAAATSSSAGAVGIGTGASVALTLTSGTTTYTSYALNSTTSTVRDLVAEINKSGIASASVDDNGKLVITGSGSNTLQIGVGQGASNAAALTAAQAGGANVALGFLAADATTGVASAGGTSAVRANLIQQFNDLRTQIDQLAKDAGYNGTNLLDGDKLSIIFNEKTGSNQNKLDVQGTTMTAANLGILQAGTTTSATTFNIQNDVDLTTASDSLTTALASLRSTASNLGSNLAVAQTRQDFTRNMVTTLQTGADYLVNADQNAEAANLLALQTRQQLSQTALSLSNQADQGVLRLFG